MVTFIVGITCLIIGILVGTALTYFALRSAMRRLGIELDEVLDLIDKMNKSEKEQAKKD